MHATFHRMLVLKRHMLAVRALQRERLMDCADGCGLAGEVSPKPLTYPICVPRAASFPAMKNGPPGLVFCLGFLCTNLLQGSCLWPSPTIGAAPPRLARNHQHRPPRETTPNPNRRSIAELCGLCVFSPSPGNAAHLHSGGKYQRGCRSWCAHASSWEGGCRGLVAARQMSTFASSGPRMASPAEHRRIELSSSI